MGEEQRHLLHVLIDRGVDVKARNEHGVFMTGYDCIYEAFEDFGSSVLLAMKSSRLLRKRAMILWR
jgi:hypothetical protein